AWDGRGHELTFPGTDRRLHAYLVMMNFWTDARRMRRAVIALALILGQVAATSAAAGSPCVRKHVVEASSTHVGETTDVAVVSLQGRVAVERSAPAPHGPAPDEPVAAAGASCTVLVFGTLPDG